MSQAVRKLRSERWSHFPGVHSSEEEGLGRAAPGDHDCPLLTTEEVQPCV